MLRASLRFIPVLFIGSVGWGQPAATQGLTLAQAIDQALQNNLATKAAQEGIAESRAQSAVARSALLPNIAGSAYQANLTMNLAAQGFTPSTFPGIPAFIGPFNRFDARFQAYQSLFDLASIRRYQATRYGVELAALQKRLAEEQVATATALSYIGVLEAGQAVAAAQANIRLAQSLLDLATNQRIAGIATGLDVARAETRLAGQQVNLAQAKTNLDTARLNLLRVIGAPLAGEITLSEAMHFMPEAPSATEEIVKQAIAGRLELVVAAEQLKIAQTEYRAAAGGWSPSVSAFGDYGSSGLKSNEIDLPTRTVGVRIDVPIFNGGRTSAEAQAAASHVRQAEMRLADLRAAVEKDARLALENLFTGEEQMHAAQKNLDLAQRELDLAQDRFKNGVADNIEVTNAQTALENARRMAVSSLAQFNVARLNLFSALGRGKDFTF